MSVDNTQSPYVYADIRRVRENLKLTQIDMAVVLGVSRLTFIKWENDIDTIPLGKYAKLVNYYERLKQL